MMRVDTCSLCRHKNESPTAICSRPQCPLMGGQKSPFKFPFSKPTKKKLKDEIYEGGWENQGGNYFDPKN